MQRPFESTSVMKDSDDKATLKLSHRKFKKSDEAHTDLKDGNLHIQATIEGKLHGKVIENIDIDPATKIEKHNGSFDVKIKKKSKFSIAGKLG